MARWRTYTALAVFLVALLVPLVGSWLRRERLARCSLDGLPIAPVYQVRLVIQEGTEPRFCCIRCAQTWLSLEGLTPQAVLVTDEVSGKEIEASLAWFVRSSIVTTPITGNRIHTFSNRADANRHADLNRGRVLVGADRPFGR